MRQFVYEHEIEQSLLGYNRKYFKRLIFVSIFKTAINVGELTVQYLVQYYKFDLIYVICRLPGSTDTDDPEDSEYNFMAEEQKEEQEEYRTDRAVKISRKIVLIRNLTI